MVQIVATTETKTHGMYEPIFSDARVAIVSA